MKKTLSVLSAAVLSLILTGCGGPKPADTVTSFLTSFQKGDVEKAGKFVKGQLKSTLSTGEEEDGPVSEKLMTAFTKGYKFETPKEVSSKGDTAKVKVKVTSVDVKEAIGSAMSELMPSALAAAFVEGGDSEEAVDKLVEKTIIKKLTSEDAAFDTRSVTLTLKKDKKGEYKILANDQLKEAVLANMNDLEQSLREAEEGEPASSKK
ncbi:DUF4878 domain-containing protein [Peribacillus sp. SCS-26]|uniref:DUF4878 domain-containing protein n=1 Tax=Paraperibacillus marinus TaxID=3115295 RepID=UPI0039059AA5